MMQSPRNTLEPADEHRLALAAVSGGYLTSEQLEELITEHTRRGGTPTLAQLLVSKGYLTDQALAQLMREDAEEDASQEQDMRLGQILVEEGAVTDTQVERALTIQEDAAAGGADVVPKLGEILVEKGYCNQDQVHHALELQEAAGRTCEACGKHCAAILLDMAESDRCPYCGKKFPDAGKGDGAATAVPGRKEKSRTTTSLRVKPRPAEQQRKDRVTAVIPRPAPPKPVPAELQRLGKYELRHELGRGAMGVVYEALDVSLNRRVALKLVSLAGGGQKESPEDVQRFIKEARLSALLPKHPNVVTVYDAGALEGRHYLAMELIQGEPFSSWRRKASVTIRHQVRLLRDVALAVHHAHEHGVLHCDLKPHNVMVDTKKVPYVTDFGLARRVDVPTPLAPAGMTVGTPAYMSPEQAQGLKNLDRRTDVYSLGVMLYEAFTGRLPFRAKTPEEMLVKTVQEPLRPPSAVAKSLASGDRAKSVDALCLKALAKKPQNRYATAKALADDLTRWLKRQPLEPGRATGPISSIRRPAPKSRKWIPVAAVGAVLAVVLFLALRSSGPQASPDFDRAEQLYRRQDYAAALAAYQRAVDIDPGDERAAEGVARARAKVKEQQEIAARKNDLEKEKADLEKARLELAAKAEKTKKAELELKAELERTAERERQAEADRKAAEQKAAEEAERARVAALDQRPNGRREPTDWLLATPFDNQGIDSPHPPEVSIDLSKEMQGKNGMVRWEPKTALMRAAPNNGQAAFFNFGGMYGANTTNVVIYALIHVKATEATAATLLVGSDDGIKIWVNGTVVHNHNIGRGVVVDDDVVPIRLKQGWNRLLFKITQYEAAWGMAARITDSNRKAIPGLEYDAYGDLPRPGENR